MDKTIAKFLKKTKILSKHCCGYLVETTEPVFVYKKAIAISKNLWDDYSLALVTLELPVGTKVVIPEAVSHRAWSEFRKLRANKAKVVKIKNATSKRYVDEAESLYANMFRYKVGKTVKPTRKFNEKPQIECASGIHFFLTKTEAVKY